MSLQVWSETEDFLTGLLCPPDPDLERVLQVSAEANLPPINVSALQGKQISLLAKLIGSRRILEVGSLGGYSTLWLAKALPPDGRMIAVDNNPLHAAVATGNIKEAGLSDRVEIRVGNAVDQLAGLIAERAEPFDFFFVDADQHNNVAYFEGCRQLARAGSPAPEIVIDVSSRRGARTESPMVNVVACRGVLLHDSLAAIQS